MKRTIIAGLCFVMLLRSLPAQEGQTLAVLDFDALGVSQPEAMVLTNRLRSYLVQIGLFRIIERGQMEQILKEQDFQDTGCTSDECAVEVGRLLGVELMLAGSIGKIGPIYSLDMRIINVETGEFIKTASHDIRGSIDVVLTEGLAEVARLISGIPGAKAEPSRPAGPAYGKLTIFSTPSGASLAIDGNAAGQTPQTALDLEAGRSHTIRASLPGYGAIDTTVSVLGGGSTRLDLIFRTLMGFLTVEGNVASRVRIDGRRIGKTPISNYSLLIGDYTLKVTTPEYFPFTREFSIGEGRKTTVSFTLQKKPRLPAVVLSLALPGSGQLYQGYGGKGLLFAAAVAGLGYACYAHHQEFLNINDDYDHLLEEHNNATDLDVIRAKKQAVLQSLDDMKTDEQMRNIFLGGLGALWLVNIIDVTF